MDLRSSSRDQRSDCPEKVLQRHFEMAVFSQMLWDPKSDNLYVEGSDQYSDYRERLISWKDYVQQVDAYV
jgi:hypothetical protein